MKKQVLKLEEKIQKLNEVKKHLDKIISNKKNNLKVAQESHKTVNPEQNFYPKNKRIKQIKKRYTGPVFSPENAAEVTINENKISFDVALFIHAYLLQYFSSTNSFWISIRKLKSSSITIMVYYQCFYFR